MMAPGIGARARFWMRTALTCLLAAGLGSSTAAAQSKNPPEAAAPPVKQALVTIHLREPNLRITDAKFRLLFETFEKKSVTLTDYDFGAALGEELLHSLANDTRARWRLPQGDEPLFLRSYFEEKTSQGALPSTVPADRLLLVDVRHYGWGGAGFYVLAELRMVDRASGGLLWKERAYKGFVEKDKERRKPENWMANNQKVLKESLNRLIELFCADARKKVEKKPL